MRKRSMRRMQVYYRMAVGLFFLTGCSANVPLPWESDALDPGKIATREPLDIPPDLTILPDPKTGEPRESVSASSESAGGPTAATILFDAPERKTVEPLGRNEPESLPDWMGKGADDTR